MNKQAKGNERIEALKERQKHIQAALAAEHLKRQKREKREAEKEQSTIGAAVVQAAAVSPEFRLMISQTALREADGKTREFLTGRGWNV